MKPSKTTKQKTNKVKRLTGLAREDRLVKQKCFCFFRNLANKSYNAPKGPNVYVKKACRIKRNKTANIQLRLGENVYK